LARSFLTSDSRYAICLALNYCAVNNGGYPAQDATAVRPHAPISVGGSSRTYDGNGNLTARAGATLTYDGDNRLT